MSKSKGNTNGNRKDNTRGHVSFTWQGSQEIKARTQGINCPSSARSAQPGEFKLSISIHLDKSGLGAGGQACDKVVDAERNSGEDQHTKLGQLQNPQLWLQRHPFHPFITAKWPLSSLDPRFWTSSSSPWRSVPCRSRRRQKPRQRWMRRWGPGRPEGQWRSLEGGREDLFLVVMTSTSACASCHQITSVLLPSPLVWCTKTTVAG